MKFLHQRTKEWYETRTVEYKYTFYVCTHRTKYPDTRLIWKKNE